MAITITHSFVSPKLDGPDPTVVRPSNWNDEHVLGGSGWLVAGQVIDYIGHTIPTGFLECYGQSVAAVSYPLLYDALVKTATVTLTLGSPGTVNWPSHGLIVGAKVRFRTTGALPTGLVANTDYFVVSAAFTTDAFRVAATAGGTAIDFTGSQSGVHTGVNAQYGVSTDLTTFTVPDLRGRVTAGLDIMGGVSANRLTSASGLDGDILGAVGGLETHTLTLAQLAAHQHNNNPPNPSVNFSGLVVTIGSGGGHTHTDTFTIEGSSLGPAGGHTHAHTLDVGGTLGNEAAHTHNSGTLAGVTDTEAAHTHTVGSNQAHNTPTTGGADRLVNFVASGGGDHVVATSSGGAHAHTVDVNSGNTGAGTSHTHSLTGVTVTGAITAVADHTHPFVGGSIGGGIDAVGGHTHTATPSGTIISSQANFLSEIVGGGGAHPNVQPTFIVRKLLYVG